MVAFGDSASMELETRRRRFWLGLGTLWLLTLVAGGSFLVVAHKTNEVFNPPLDDTYIYYQYAKQIARGQLFRYNDGDSVSTGSTSVIYPMLLAPFWLAGLRGPLLFWGGVVINLLGLLAAATFVFTALRRLLPHDQLLAWIGGVLTLGNGWFLWGVLSGMDIGLTAGSLALALHTIVVFFQERRRWPLAVGLALLAVSRPEGLALTWLICGVLWAWRALHAMPAREPSAADASPAPTTWRDRAPLRLLRAALTAEGRLPWPLVVGLLLGTAPTILLAIASGHLSTNGMVLKSHWAHEIGWVRYLDVSCRTLLAFPEHILWTPSAWLRGMIMVAAVAGIAGLWRGRFATDHEGHGGGPGFLIVACWAGLLLFYGFFMPATEQHNRYYMPYVPLVVITLTFGANTLALPFPPSLQGAIRRSTIAVLAIIGLSSVGHWAKNYAENCNDLADQHVVMASWMRANLRDEAVVAINDAGALAYLGERRIVDLLGLVTNDLRAPGHWRAEGPMWEQLERLRPTHLIIYPAFFDDLHRLPVMKRIHAVNIKRETLLGDREKVVYEVLWERSLSGDAPRSVPPARSTWTLIDHLDVADLKSEAAHDYRIDHGDVVGAARFRLRTFNKGPMTAVIDGGRSFSNGRERFTLGGVRIGRPAILGVRSDFSAEVDLHIFVNGRELPTWTVGVLDHKRSSEAYVELPAADLGSTTARIEVRRNGKDSFSSFHYFLLQP
jgi:hypothetical protein